MTSSSTTTTITNTTTTTTTIPTPAQVKQLIEEKDKIEVEIKAITESLAHSGFGVEGNLVDREGFPHKDVETILSVRESRNKLATLQTDHMNLMKMIEQKLYELHSAAREASPSSSHFTALPSTISSSSQQQQQKEEEPLYEIDEVTAGSPAEQAGLHVGDKVVQFGSIHGKSGATTLKTLADLVRDSEGKQVEVSVLRGNSTKQLVLVPKKWSGVGLLGCHLKPIS